jgi:transmembrane sensor
VSISPDQLSIFNRLLEGELSPGETAYLIKWLGSEVQDPVAAELIMTQLMQAASDEEIDPAIRTALNAKLPVILAKAKSSPTYRIPFLKSYWLRYAAAIIILLGIGAFFFLNRPSKKITTPGVVKSKKDIAPGKDGAILTLEDGRTIVLDSLGNGVIAEQNGTKVVLKNGQLVYDKDGSDGSAIAYNTMTTPRGRQFQLVLPDGSKVWMNAASSLRYPTMFTGNERKVEVSGEVYFEVAKNAKMPFRVKVNDETEIEVLGTHFNINAYKNEASISTSLLEGSVKIISGQDNAILKPGQQGQVYNGAARSPIKIVQSVDMEKVMAWKNGVFNFEDATLEEVMRQLERWYDIEVVYEKGIPKQEFIGKMGRDLNLSEVLRGLEMNKVHFRIEDGRKLVVLP